VGLYRCLPSLLFLHPPLAARVFLFFTDNATTEIYTLSLHDALPISPVSLYPEAGAEWSGPQWGMAIDLDACLGCGARSMAIPHRSEEHTSELQSRENLVCRLLLEKKKTHVHAYRHAQADTAE